MVLYHLSVSLAEDWKTQDRRTLGLAGVFRQQSNFLVAESLELDDQDDFSVRIHYYYAETQCSVCC